MSYLGAANVDSVLDRLVRRVSRTLPTTIRLSAEVKLGRYVMLSEEALERVVLNLCLNARDAMPDGGLITVCAFELPTDSLEAVVRIEVSDTGRGMPPGTKARAFEPFFTTKEPGRGTGLGLTQVYAIVTSCNGRVEIVDSAAGGITVRVELPLHATSDVPGSNATDQRKTRPGGQPRASLSANEAREEIGPGSRAPNLHVSRVVPAIP